LVCLCMLTCFLLISKWNCRWDIVCWQIDATDTMLDLGFWSINFVQNICIRIHLACLFLYLCVTGEWNMTQISYTQIESSWWKVFRSAILRTFSHFSTASKACLARANFGQLYVIWSRDVCRTQNRLNFF